jgi:hypothetical protein
MNLMSPIARQNAPTTPVRISARSRLPAIIVALAILLAALLALPGQTVTTKYVNDLFIFLDGAYRVSLGQVPNVDFHSSLGPLAFYIPALGYVLGGSLAAAMPVGMALTTVGFGLLAAHVIGSRMRPTIGVPLAVFLLLVMVAPLNPGEGLGDISFAMFYNRIGWSGVGLLLVMFLPPLAPPTRRQTAMDALSAAVLVLVMVYLKASYGAVAAAFVVFMLFDRCQRRWAALALGTSIVAAALIELLWHGSLAYIADLQLAGEVSGNLPDIHRLLTIVLQNLADVAVFLMFAAMLMFSRLLIREALYVGFCASTGILLIEQNFQIVGILTLGAGAATIAEALARRTAAKNGRASLGRAGSPLLLAILLLPVSAQNAGVLLMHSSLALTGSGEQMPLLHFQGIRLAGLWNEGLFNNFRRYNQSLADGVAALDRLDTPASHVLVLDFVGPFAAGMRLMPAKGDSPWYHWGRTIDDKHYPAAATLFADIDVVMEPKWPIEVWTAGGMRRVYAQAIERDFRLARESADWRIYVRTAPVGAASHAQP